MITNFQMVSNTTVSITIQPIQYNMLNLYTTYSNQQSKSMFRMAYFSHEQLHRVREAVQKNHMPYIGPTHGKSTLYSIPCTQQYCKWRLETFWELVQLEVIMRYRWLHFCGIQERRKVRIHFQERLQWKPLLVWICWVDKDFRKGFQETEQCQGLTLHHSLLRHPFWTANLYYILFESTIAFKFP